MVMCHIEQALEIIHTSQARIYFEIIGRVIAVVGSRIKNRIEIDGIDP